jgi:hypothetical protein
MPRTRTRPLVAALLLLMACAGIIQAQRRSPMRAPVQPRPAQQPNPAQGAAGPDKYWEAQRSIEAAIQQLEEYLRAEPGGARSATARRQLQVLRGLSLTASRPEWTRMDSLSLSHVPRWRVSAVDPQRDGTRVTVEIDCGRADGGDCYFDPFDRAPLVLIDDAGRFYPMLEAVPLPPDVRLREGSQAALSGGRTISVDVTFAPLSGGVASGQIYYRDRNRAQPARFSLPGGRKP